MRWGFIKKTLALTVLHGTAQRTKNKPTINQKMDTKLAEDVTSLKDK